MLLTALLVSVGLHASTAPNEVLANALTLSDVLTSDPRDSVGFNLWKILFRWPSSPAWP